MSVWTWTPYCITTHNGKDPCPKCFGAGYTVKFSGNSTTCKTCNFVCFAHLENDEKFRQAFPGVSKFWRES